MSRSKRMQYVRLDLKYVCAGCGKDRTKIVSGAYFPTSSIARSEFDREKCLANLKYRVSELSETKIYCTQCLKPEIAAPA